MERESTLSRISPRSALRVAAAMNAVLFLVWMVVALVVFIGLGVSGVWGRMNSLLADLTGSDTVGAGTYFGAAAAVGVLEAVVVTLLAPVAAVLYNSVATLVGGLRVTVGEPDADAPEDTAMATDGGTPRWPQTATQTMLTPWGQWAQRMRPAWRARPRR